MGSLNRHLCVLGSILILSTTFRASAQKPAPPKVPLPKPSPVATNNRITRFSPTSDRADHRVDTVNQIRVEFGAPMVKLGSGAQTGGDVFDITCSPRVEGRASWNSDHTWIFDFNSDNDGNFISGGTRCDVKLKSGVKTLAGQPILGTRSYLFVIDGPNIVAITPDQSGDSDASNPDYDDPKKKAPTDDAATGVINEDQVFVIQTDAIVDPKSIAPNVYFLAEGGSKSRISAELLSGKDLEEVLKAHSVDKEKIPLTVVIKPKGEFPNDKKVNLVWGAGVKALQSGIARVTQNVRNYEVRKTLRADVTCYRVNANSGCMPLGDIRVIFSADVPRDQVESAYILLPNGKTMKPDFYTEYGEQTNHVGELRFRGPFPENGDFKIVLPNMIKDEKGRPLENAKSFPLALKTASMPPLIKFAAKFGLVEANIGADTGVPVTVRNIEAQALGKLATPADFPGKSLRLSPENFPQVISWLQKVSDSADSPPGDGDEEDKRGASIFGKSDKTTSFSVPLIDPAKGKPSQDTVALIPLNGPGFYVVEMQSKILGNALIAADDKAPKKDRTMYVPTAALVTNMVVHVKHGRENSLFWVTKLDSGEPMAGAQVSVFGCDGKQIGQNVTTDGDGIARVGQDVSAQMTNVRCADSTSYPYGNGYYVTAWQGNDFTFTHSSWNEGIELFRFGNINSGEYDYDNGKLAVHTVFDRVLLRAGETVSMKTFARAKVTTGLGKVAAKDLPTQMVIQHEGDDTKYTLPIDWDMNSQATLNSWAIPPNAKLGSYSVTLATNNPQGDTYRAGRLQVQEFKIPLMKANIVFPDKEEINPGSVDVQLKVDYQNGGAAKDLPVKLTYTISRVSGLTFPNYDDFTIGNGGMTPKVIKDGEENDKNKMSVTKPATLDANGVAVVTIDDLKGFRQPQRVETSLEYRDSIGETQTLGRNLTVYSSDRLVGIKVGDAYTAKQKNPFTVVVLDNSGKPQAGAQVQIRVLEEITSSVRSRGVGGTYIYDNTTVIKDADNAQSQCAAQSDSKGLVQCTLKTKPGNYYVVASVSSAGNVSEAYTYIHIAGRKDNTYAGTSDDRFDLLSQKSEYDPGETAKLEAKIPFQKATVLLTTEREGIIDAKVLRNWTPQQFIDYKVDGKYAPNVFVSVLAVRGRIPSTSDDSKIDGMVDLAKPSYKLGMTKIGVSTTAHQLKVEVTPGVMNNGEFAAQEKFEPRNEVAPMIKVTDLLTGAPATGEVAVAVVDEGLLELLPNKSWDVLAKLLKARSLDVETFTAQMQVIGKRHYGLKAVPLGGDGSNMPSQGSTRKLFDTLVKWTGSVKLDASGVANLTCANTQDINKSNDCVRFKLNDSLTKFRIVAIASSGLDKFGTGQSDVLSTKDFIIESSMSGVARNGDTQKTEFSVRNTTDKAASVNVCGNIELTKTDGTKQMLALDCKEIELAAQSAQSVNLNDVSIPDGVISAKYNLSVQDQNKKILDGRPVEQKISPNVLTRTLMAQLAQVTQPILTDVEVPQTAVAGQGGVSVKLFDTLTSGLTTVKDRFDSYLFDSIEFRISRAIATRDKAIWQSAMKLLPPLIDENGLVKFYTGSKDGSEYLTGFILKVSKLANEPGYEIPADLRGKMLEGLKAFADGKVRNGKGGASKNDPKGVFIARAHAIQALVLYKYQTKDSLGKTDLVSMPNITLIDLLSIYDTLGMTAQRGEVETVLRNSRLHQAGTTWSLNQDSQRAQSFELLNSYDSDTAELVQAILNSNDQAFKNGFSPVVMGLVLSSNAKLQERKGSWDTTMANALMTLSYREFSKVYENTPVTGITEVALAQQTASVDWSAKPHGDLVNFAWPQNAEKLSVEHKGSSAPWALVSVSAAIPITEPMGSVRIEKKVEPIEQVTSGKYAVGDTFKVTLTIKASAPVSQLALMDPIPAGAQIMKSKFGGDSGETYNWSVGYEELGADSYRAYLTDVGEQPIEITYRIRLNNEGNFQLPATTVEALYTPEVYGVIPNAAWLIGK
jgi:alpha-2-macroglobulin